MPGNADWRAKIFLHAFSSLPPHLRDRRLNSGPILLISSPRDVHYALADVVINFDADSISVTEN
jgi:hypothetical protein